MWHDRTGCSSTESSDDNDDHQRNYFNKKVELPIMPRPNASPGFWLCCLLPAALTTYYIREEQHPTIEKLPASCETTSGYDTLTIAATGMCIESLCFFMYLFVDTGILLKLLISVVPSVLTSSLFVLLKHENLGYSVFWGFATTFCYQSAYIRVMRGLPRSFSYGEAAVLVQGLMLFVMTAVMKVPNWLAMVDQGAQPFNELEQFDYFNAIMVSGLFCLLSCCWLLTKFARLREAFHFYLLLVLLVFAVTCIPVTRPLPIIIVFRYIFFDFSLFYLTIYYEFLAVVTACVVCSQLYNRNKASTSARKLFHILIVLVYLPGMVAQCAFLYLASGVALAAFTVLELFRILDIPPLAKMLKTAFHIFCDEKDAGLLAITPFCLLIGCSLPMWISPYPCCSNCVQRLLPALSGVFALGFGDTAASVVGSNYGRIKWPNSRRTVEGTIAFIVSVLTTICILNYQEDKFNWTNSQLIAAVLATVITAMVEAFTDQIDNLVLPLVFYIIVNLG